MHMPGPRGQGERGEMGPPGPRADMAFAAPDGIPYGQQRGGDFLRGGEMQRGRGRGGRMGPPGRGGGRRLMDEGPMFDPAPEG